MPPGPDREAIIRHLEVVFNHIIHHMVNDDDGPQKAEVVWMLEKTRRALHLVLISKNKQLAKEILGAFDKIFEYIANIVELISRSDPVKGAGAKIAADELRRVVKRKIAKRRREAEAGQDR